MQNRKIIAGALTIAPGFNIVGVKTEVMIRLSTPKGEEFEIPLELKIYENMDEYEIRTSEFLKSAKQLESIQ